MKKNFFFLLAVFFLLPPFTNERDAGFIVAGGHTQYVNPFIGTQTDGSGALSGGTFPGACVPLGMVQLSPDTELYPTWDPCSGYDYDHSRIYGFSHTHLSGTGCTDLFDVMLMPTDEECTLETLTKGDFSQSFTHDDEQARPGYYQVRLHPSGINAELSATPHAGIHRYTFPKEGSQTLIVDLDHSTYRGEDAYYTGKRTYQILAAQLRIVDDHTIEGWMRCTPETGGWGNGAGHAFYTVYFHAEFDKPFTNSGFWTADIPADWERKREEVTSLPYLERVA